MRVLNEQEKLELETLVDRCGLSFVLMELSEICGGKSQHLAENWQDASAAKDWATMGDTVHGIVYRAVARSL